MTQPSPAERPTSAGPPLWPEVPGYEIVAELGRGGMGVVYRARQQSSGRLVALKLVRDAALGRPDQRARFRIEAEAAARMRHDHIVQIVEVGEHQGWPYLAMELVEGGGLDAFLANQPRPVAQAAAFVRTLALAVEHAHQQKVVHRDLKPANILLAGPGLASAADSPPPPHELERFIPKITDFGLAKRLDSDSTAWTQAGAVLGTASYMAPEQAAGSTAEIGPATDVYALGAILYELLAGRPPFEAASWPQTVQLVLHEEPVPPTRLQADVPSDLETICLQCLEKEPLRRYSSAQALADDLERHAAGRPIAAQPPSETERLARLAARDGYEILGEIGRGPRSTVYRAVHGPLRQSVALKVFEAGLCTRDQWGAWLRRGAAESTGLEHPCLVPILQTGWWSGRAYVATEHAPQGSLDARLLDARLKGEFFPLRPALELVERLTEIVGYVHRQGAVHGNLKPSNVLLAADGIPRLADFRLTGGLFVARNAADQPSPPGRGQSEGSGVSQNASADAAALAYLAPELLADPAAEPRLNADIYGLGLILYELLAGRPAFQATTASDMLELVGRGCPPPSSLNPQAPAALDAVCAKCLRRDPWRRYARAFDVGKRLRGILEVGPGRGGIP